MIESSISTKVSNPQVKTSPTDRKSENSIYVLEGIIAGSALGQTANFLIPIQQDVFTKTESDLLKVTTPIKNKEWSSLVEEIVKGRRSVKYNIIGAIAGGVAAFVHCKIM